MRGRKEGQGISNLPLRLLLTTYIDLRIPHFLRSVPPGTVGQLSFDSRSAEAWYENTLSLMVSKIGVGHFPVFRFSDGEGVFTVGFKFPPVPTGVSVLVHYVRTFLSAYVKHRQHKIFWSGTPGYGYETYTPEEWKRARPLFSLYLREIAAEGLLACNFCRHPEPFLLNRSLPSVLDWMDQSEVALSADNYVPFYFLYGMLIGPDRHLFIQNRRILVVTSFTASTEAELREYFVREGALSVEFLPISRSKSMFDRVDLGQLRHGVDVAFVGAGVGAANILQQLRPLNTLCVDAGYALDCYRDPQRKGSRIFTKPDEEL
jgi:hypothetical protein